MNVSRLMAEKVVKAAADAAHDELAALRADEKAAVRSGQGREEHDDEGADDVHEAGGPKGAQAEHGDGEGPGKEAQQRTDRRARADGQIEPRLSCRPRHPNTRVIAANPMATPTTQKPAESTTLSIAARGSPARARLSVCRQNEDTVV